MRFVLHAALSLALATGPALAAPPVASVTIKDFDFQPMAVEIPVGATVVWKNLDGEPHTVVALDGSFRSEALDQGDSYSRTFAKPGLYKIICSIHPRMTATVTVKAAPP